MYFALVLLCAGALALPQAPRPIYDLEQAEELFEQFIVDFHKQYRNEAEKQRRFEIFKDKLRYINQRNSDPEESATFGITTFTDIHLNKKTRNHRFTEEELPFDMIKNFKNVSSSLGNINLPENFNWVDHNMVTPVKDMGRCQEAYWAFAVTGLLEGAYAIKHKKLISLSEQQLVDCVYDNCGCCAFGNTHNAMRYVIEAGGLQNSSSYKYTSNETGVISKCNFNSKEVVAKVKHVLRLPLDEMDEEQLRELLYTLGPITLNVGIYDFMYYEAGILKKCSAKPWRGYVLLVGYGTGSSGTKYWIFKTSYGTGVGEAGYIRAVRGKNICDMMNKDAMAVEVV